jgi:hypothetical protein
MDTVPCRMNDGVCTIPEHALVVRQGELAVRTRAEVVREFPGLDLKARKLRPFEFDGTHDDLLEGARRLEQTDADASSDDSDESGGGITLMEPAVHEAVAAAIADAGLTNALIVLCSPCGHQWILDL